MPRKRKAVEPYNTGRAANKLATGKAYGENKRQQEALAAIPLQGRGAPAPAAPQGAPPDFQAVLAAAKNSPQPQGGILNRPTDRPDVPLTAGLASGPGPGPEVLQVDNPDLANLRGYLPMLELMASQPNASQSARNFVRRLRGAMPPL